MKPAGSSRRHTTRAVALGSLLAVCTALPASAGDFSRAGFYLGVGGSYTTDLYENEIEDAIAVPGVSVDVESTPGVNARAGLRFLKFLAVELQYEWLDEYDIDVSFAGLGGTLEVKQQTLTANLKIYPIPAWRLQPYILAGVGFQRFELDGSVAGGLFIASEDDTALAGRAGAGLDIYLTEHIVIFGEASVVFTDLEIGLPAAIGSNVDNIFYVGGQAGLMWRF